MERYGGVVGCSFVEEKGGNPTNELEARAKGELAADASRVERISRDKIWSGQ